MSTTRTGRCDCHSWVSTRGSVAGVCLLIALSGVLPAAPLLMAANRDELYDRPAEVMTVLRERGPRILGGRDLVAGGTWLAVNSHGVVAGLTNQPSARARDDTRRSRGELPLAFAAYPDAATAVAKVCADLDPSDYNPCWLLVGDRHALFSVGMTGAHHPVVEQLPPGTYVLENVPLTDDSAKARQVAAMVAAGLAGATELGGSIGIDAAEQALAAVLRDHRPAAGPQEPDASAGGRDLPDGRDGAGGRDGAAGRVRPAELSAACVHTASYGTRSAMIVSVGATGRPRVRVADGPPCRAPFEDATALWTAPGRDSAPSM
jgi:uncharacterized protein with NRDE domain